MRWINHSSNLIDVNIVTCVCVLVCVLVLCLCVNEIVHNVYECQRMSLFFFIVRVSMCVCVCVSALGKLHKGINSN